MQLKVVLPSGEVNVPVEPNSTPGHLKENLKYSLRVPPKQIRLTCEGRELDDIKPISGEPNNVKDGAVIIAEPKEGAQLEEEAEAESAKAEKRQAERPPMMIKKEEPPKPKKPKKEVVRPTVGEGDVVKKRVLQPGQESWEPKYLEGKQSQRHMAFMRIEIVSGGSSATGALEPQMNVRVQGLKSKPEYNGMEGCLVQFDEQKGRWQTKLSSGATLEVKADNLEALGTSQGKKYPEQEDGHLAIALGDPQTSPAWTAAAVQMQIGEKAEFAMTNKVVDYDLEGLNPTDFGSSYIVHLLQIEEVIDVAGDFSQLLHVENEGKKERAEELDAVAVHWRVRRWMAEGCFCIASSRERIAIMPGYGLVPIEDQRAPPVNISVGEGQQEAVELIALRVGPGGLGHMYLKSEALKENRPGGCVVIDVELVAMDSNRGPGSPGWRGWHSLVVEREKGEQWLEEGDGRRKQLETFGTLKKSTGDSKDAEAHVAAQVHKFANNASRRLRRALKWIESGGEAMDSEGEKVKVEEATLRMRLAKASTLAHFRFGDAAEAEASEEEKEALREAQVLLKDALTYGEASKNESLVYECLKMSLQAAIQAQDLTEARQVLERLQGLRPDDDELKSDSARINRLETALMLKKGANTIDTVQKDLQAAVTGTDKPKVTECLNTILGMLVEKQVTWDTVRTLKVGKDVGNAMKMGDPDLAALGQKIVREIQQLAQRAGIGL